MAFTAAFIGVTLLSGFTSAIPHPQANPVLSMVSLVPTATPVSSSPVSAAATSYVALLTSRYNPVILNALRYSADSSMVTASSSAGGYSAVGSGSSMWDSSSMATSTSMAYGSYSSPAYGSGSTNWGGSGYDGCVARKPTSYIPSEILTLNYHRMYSFFWFTASNLHACCYYCYHRQQHGQFWLWLHHHGDCRSDAGSSSLCSFRCKRLSWRHHQVHVGCQQPYGHKIVRADAVQQDLRCSVCFRNSKQGLRV